MLKRISTAKLPYDTRLGNRVRAVSAFILLLCILTLALFLRFDGRDGSLAYKLLCLQFPFFKELLPPEPQPPSQSNHIIIEHADIDPGVSEEIKIKLSRITQPEHVNLSGTQPRILIYHTHTTEAYRQTAEYVYVESADWRTLDYEKNIVAVGEELAQVLKDKYGINVIHDKTNHEIGEKGTSSYTRSLATMEAYKKQYPSITMFIDVHRDAGSGTEDVVILDGQRVARMMFVVGTGEGATGTGFSQMPDFESNFALAKRVTEQLLKLDPKLMRDIRVKKSRYNQHMSNQCLLIEVGHNNNTLEEALAAVDYLAAAIADCGGMGVVVKGEENESENSSDSQPVSGSDITQNSADAQGGSGSENQEENQMPLPLTP